MNLTGRFEPLTDLSGSLTPFGIATAWSVGKKAANKLLLVQEFNFEEVESQPADKTAVLVLVSSVQAVPVDKAANEVEIKPIAPAGYSNIH